MFDLIFMFDAPSVSAGVQFASQSVRYSSAQTTVKWFQQQKPPSSSWCLRNRCTSNWACPKRWDSQTDRLFRTFLSGKIWCVHRDIHILYIKHTVTCICSHVQEVKGNKSFYKDERNTFVCLSVCLSADVLSRWTCQSERRNHQLVQQEHQRRQCVRWLHTRCF